MKRNGSFILFRLKLSNKAAVSFRLDLYKEGRKDEHCALYIQIYETFSTRYFERDKNSVCISVPSPPTLATEEKWGKIAMSVAKSF